MLKMWGRNTSSNVQKAMWAVGELNLPCERIDVGGAFGKTKDAFYLAMNPNALVPTLEEEDGFTLWESNSVVRYLAAKHGGLEPADPTLFRRAEVNVTRRFRDFVYAHQDGAVKPGDRVVTAGSLLLENCQSPETQQLCSSGRAIGRLDPTGVGHQLLPHSDAGWSSLVSSCVSS